MVQHLNLWNENPRLDPSLEYSHFNDFINEIIISESDRKNFINLAESIVYKGFIPADPIVVWQNDENRKYYVAEGNRRVAVLKLLLNPNKSPKSIKSSFIKLSKQVNRSSITKIPVAIAPTFKDAIWYITERHTPSSQQKKWERESHLRWINNLYEMFNNDIEHIQEYTNLSQTSLNEALCIIKIKDRVKDMQDYLTPQEFIDANSKSFPISTLERFLKKDFVKEKLGISFDGSTINYESENDSFLNALAYLIKRILLPKGDANRIDSRSHNKNEEIKAVMEELPEVKIKDSSNINSNENISTEVNNNNYPKELPTSEQVPSIPLRNNPNRPNIIVPEDFLETDDFRLRSLFDELKKLPLSRYSNIASTAIRVFLDVAIRTYIQNEELENEIAKKEKGAFENTTLSSRIKYLKDNSKLNSKSKRILSSLVDSNHKFSLHILNCYVHSSETYAINKNYINSFWDFLFPLFQEILDIKAL